MATAKGGHASLCGATEPVYAVRAVGAIEGLLKERRTTIVHQKRRYGYRRIHMLLKREGIDINHKKLFRIYKQLELKVLKRGGQKKAFGTRILAMELTNKNQEWSFDFVRDMPASGRRIPHANSSG